MLPARGLRRLVLTVDMVAGDMCETQAVARESEGAVAAAVVGTGWAATT